MASDAEEGPPAKRRRAENGQSDGANSHADAQDGGDANGDAAPDVRALLAESDNESSSSSSSSETEDNIEPAEAEAAPAADAAAAGTGGSWQGQDAEDEAPLLPVQGEGGGEAELPGLPPPSPSSSSSSSSSSSESDSESEAPEEVLDEALRAVEEEQEEQNAYEIAKRAMLKRDEVIKMLMNLPLEAAQEAILRCFVRLVMKASSGQRTGCVLAEVVGLEPSEAYQVVRANGESCKVRFKILCRRGCAERSMKISVISNQDLTEGEFDAWRRVVEKTGVDFSIYAEAMRRKAADINDARNFKFTDKVVSDMLKKKGSVEFDAQKESRMRFLVQCAMSQMDISGIRENDVRELEQRYQDSLSQLHAQEKRSAEVQSQWFKNRANLFSLKMINKKNYERQVADDRHALEYTLQTENATNAGLNPFQRRACRPLVAWDTKLTAADGLPTNAQSDAEAPQAGNSNAAAPAAGGNASGDQDSNDARPSGADRMSRLLRAHSGARHILAGLSGYGV